MEKELVMNSPFKVNKAKKPSEGMLTGDEYYHTADIVQVIEDNKIVLKVIDNPEKIKDVIDANADKCGLKNILKMYAKTGDIGLFQQGEVLNNIDATNLPTESVSDIAAKLPKDLVGNDIEAFLKSITADKLVEFYKSQNKKESEAPVNEQEK